MSPYPRKWENLGKMEKKIFDPKIVTSIKLCDCGGNIKGKWFVHYLLKGKRVKVYSLESDKRKGLNSFKTDEERRNYAARIIAEIQSLFGTGTKSTGNAADIENEQAKNLKKAEAISAESSQKSIADILEKTLDFLKPSLRIKTLQTYTCKCTIFAKYCKKHKIKVVSEQYVSDFFIWLKYIGRSNATINSYKIALSRLWKTAIAQKIINGSNPFLKVPKLKEYPQGSKPYSKSQKKELKAAISEQNPMLWLCCQFLYYCFIRPGELRNLKIGDIDLDRQKILIRGSISKNKKSEYVTIPKSFLSVLKDLKIDELPAGRYVIGTQQVGSQFCLAKNWISRSHRLILISLGYPVGRYEHNFYSWKPTGCIAAVGAGVNIVDLQRQLRHSSLDITLSYLRYYGIEACTEIREKFPEI